METMGPDSDQVIHVSVSGRGRVGTHHLLKLIPPVPTDDASRHEDEASPLPPAPDPSPPLA